MGKVLQDVNAEGTAVIFTHRVQGRRGGGPPPQFGVLALPAGTATLVTGAPAFSPDGRSLAFVTRTEPNSQLLIAPVASPIAAPPSAPAPNASTPPRSPPMPTASPTR